MASGRSFNKALIPEQGPAHIALVILLITIYMGLLLGSLRTISVTTDEFGHLPLAYAFVKTGDADWLLMNPPSQRALAALPLLFRDDISWQGPAPREVADFWYAGKYFMRQNRGIYHSLYVQARLVVAVLACITGLVIYAFARAMAGPRAGLVALFLFAFSPDFLAHGGLITCDLAAALAALAAFASLYYYTRQRTTPRLVLACVSISLIPLSKFTSLFFLVLVPLMLLSGPGKDEAGKERLFASPGLRRFALEILLTALISWIILAGAYGFQGMFTPLQEIYISSSFLGKLKATVPWLPVPLPEALLTALDLQAVDGSRPWQSYLFGDVSMHGSPWSYLACMLFKWPLPLLFLLLISLFTARKKLLLWTLAPGALFILFISSIPEKQYGLRFMLPALGLFLVFISASLVNIDFSSPFRSGSRPKWRVLCKLLIGILFLWYAVDTIAAYPHYIGYFNELARGPRLPHRGHRYLADSNLDWGQDWMRLARWQKEKGVKSIQLAYFGMVDPAIYGVKYSPARCRPGRGYLAVSANLVMGIDAFRNMGPCYKFLQDREPVFRIGSSIWVYWIE